MIFSFFVFYTRFLYVGSSVLGAAPSRNLNHIDGQDSPRHLGISRYFLGGRLMGLITTLFLSFFGANSCFAQVSLDLYGGGSLFGRFAAENKHLLELNPVVLEAYYQTQAAQQAFGVGVRLHGSPVAYKGSGFRQEGIYLSFGLSGLAEWPVFSDAFLSAAITWMPRSVMQLSSSAATVVNGAPIQHASLTSLQGHHGFDLTAKAAYRYHGFPFNRESVTGKLLAGRLGLASSLIYQPFQSKMVQAVASNGTKTRETRRVHYHMVVWTLALLVGVEF